MGYRVPVTESRHLRAEVAFSGERYFLSNFYPHEFLYNGHRYATSEHAFQAAKCVDPDEADRIRQAPSPAAAKELGRRVRRRSDWNEARVEVMRTVLAAKFADPDLRGRLLETGGEELVEENTWNDQFWGRYRGVGKNMLGRLLMELRDTLRG
jgi:ribA/ribD-fused uncharacterized protein